MLLKRHQTWNMQSHTWGGEEIWFRNIAIYWLVGQKSRSKHTCDDSSKKISGWGSSDCAPHAFADNGSAVRSKESNMEANKASREKAKHKSGYDINIHSTSPEK